MLSQERLDPDRSEEARNAYHAARARIRRLAERLRDLRGANAAEALAQHCYQRRGERLEGRARVELALSVWTMIASRPGWAREKKSGVANSQHSQKIRLDS